MNIQKAFEQIKKTVSYFERFSNNSLNNVSEIQKEQIYLKSQQLIEEIAEHYSEFEQSLDKLQFDEFKIYVKKIINLSTQFKCI